MSKDIQGSIAALAEALREHTAAETDLERAQREASGTAAFAAEVLAAWDVQELHKGRRMRYGITKEHAAYARRVRAWAWYEADSARWMREPANAAALSRMDALGFDAISDDDQARIARRPNAPIDIPQPSASHVPPHWPAAPWEAGAIGVFFGRVDG